MHEYVSVCEERVVPAVSGRWVVGCSGVDEVALCRKN